MLWCWLVVLTLSTISEAVASEWRFRHYTDMEGLSSNTVQCIFQDHNGYIWAGTKGGLNRFNSHDFTKFYADYRKSDGLSNDNIYCITSERPDSSDRLWIGTIDGIDVFDTHTQQFSHLQITIDGKFLDNVLIYTMVADYVGNMWIGTLGHGLLRYNHATQSFTQYDEKSHPTLFERNTVAKIVIDEEQQVWIGMGGSSICRYNPEQDDFSTFKVEDSLTRQSISRISTIYADNVGNIWIAGMAGDLFLFDRSTMRFSRNVPTFTGGNIRAITEREKGVLLLGTDQGLVSFNTRERTFKVEDDGRTKQTTGLNDNFIHAMICDRDGGLWIGTYYGGLNYMPAGQNIFFSPKIPEGCGQIISCFCEDVGGNIWIGSDDGGLSLYNPTTERYRSVVVDYVYPNLNIHSLLIHDGALWVGTITHGLYRVDLATMRSYKIRMHGMEHADFDVYSIFADSQGSLWIGTMRNICRYNPQTQCIEVVYDTNYNGRVANICEDSLGNIWFATNGNGLLRYMPAVKQFENFTPDAKESIPPFIGSLLVEGNNLWIGTQGQGLLRYDIMSGTLTREFADSSYGISTIFQILHADKELWLTTNNGLINYGYRHPDRPLVRYTSEDGLSANIFNANSGIKTSSGYIYVGSNNGIDRFYPYDLKQRYMRENIEVVLSNFSVLNQNISDDKRATIPTIPQQGVKFRSRKLSFSLGFIALNYSTPQRTTYRYKLENFDDEWITTDTYMHSGERRVSYTNLAPATYRFMVSASHDGEVFGDITSFEIKVLPPWWMSHAMIVVYIFMVIAILIVIATFVRRRIASQHQEQIEALMHKNNLDVLKMKFERFTDIASEIYTPLSLIVAPAESIAHQQDLSDEVRKDAEMIQRNCQKLLQLVDSISEIDNADGSKGTPRRTSEDDTSEKEEVITPAALPPQFISEDGTEYKATLLLVDKDKEFTDFFVRYFSSRYFVDTVNSGQEALSRIGESRYDLILVDWQLPDMTGEEFCRAIRSDEVIDDIPVIVLAKNSSPAAKSNMLSAGADLCIDKWASPDFATRQIHAIIYSRNKLRIKYSKTPFVQSGRDNKSLVENRFMVQVNAYIMDNIANTAITIEDIASAVGMSRTLFFTRIKQMTGLTPNEYLRTMRLKVAAELLSGDNKLRVSEICYMVGFSSTSYFAKCFQAQFGMLPNQYLEQYRE